VRDASDPRTSWSDFELARTWRSNRCLDHVSEDAPLASISMIYPVGSHSCSEGEAGGDTARRAHLVR